MSALSRVQAGLLPFALGVLVAVMTNILWMPAVNGFIGKLFPDAKIVKAVRTAANTDGQTMFGLPEVQAKDLNPANPVTSFIRNETFETVKQSAARQDVKYAVYIALSDGCGHCVQFKQSGKLADLIKALGSMFGNIVHVNDGGVPYPDQVTYLPFIGVVDADGLIREIKADRNDIQQVCNEVSRGAPVTEEAAYTLAARTNPGHNIAVPL